MIRILLAATTIAATCMVPALAHAESASMTCTGPTGKDYQVTYDGKTVTTKFGAKVSRFAIKDEYNDIVTTKPNKEGVFLNAAFSNAVDSSNPLVNFFHNGKSKAFQQDKCRNVKGQPKGMAEKWANLAKAGVSKKEYEDYITGKGKLFKIERFFGTDGGNSKAILSVTVPAGARYVEGQCAFKDRGGNVLDVSSVIALHSGYETVWGPGAASDVSCELAVRR
jgi:hypothetical protein